MIKIVLLFEWIISKCSEIERSKMFSGRLWWRAMTSATYEKIRISLWVITNARERWWTIANVRTARTRMLEWYVPTSAINSSLASYCLLSLVTINWEPCFTIVILAFSQVTPTHRPKNLENALVQVLTQLRQWNLTKY